MEEIVNRVAQSALKTFDLEEHYPKGERVVLDLSNWLEEGIVLREKNFRANLHDFDWKAYEQKYVALVCGTEAILPAWAWLLVTAYLAPYARKVVRGDLQQLEEIIFSDLIEGLDLSHLKDQLVIIKGCSDKEIPQNAWVLLTTRLQKMVKSLMFGEACSSVPLYKRPKT